MNTQRYSPVSGCQLLVGQVPVGYIHEWYAMRPDQPNVWVGRPQRLGCLAPLSICHEVCCEVAATVDSIEGASRAWMATGSFSVAMAGLAPYKQVQKTS